MRVFAGPTMATSLPGSPPLRLPSLNLTLPLSLLFPPPLPSFSLTPESNRVKRNRVVGLLQDGRHGQLRGVGEQARRPHRVPNELDRRRCQRRFERVARLGPT